MMPSRSVLRELVASRPLPHRDRMRLGSLDVEVIADQAFYLEAILALFRTEPGQHAGPPHESAARVVALEAVDSAGLVLTAPPDGLDVARAADGRWIIATEALTGHLFVTEPIELFLIMREHPTDELHFRVHLSVTLHRALLLLERLFLHAAGIRSGDTTYAFVGDKGAGKSTLTLALGLAGATVLADDHLVLRRDGSRFLASGCDREARLLEDAEHHLFGGPLATRLVELGGVRKREVAIGRYCTSQPFREYPLDRLVFPSVGEKFEVRSLSRRDALIELIRTTRSSHRFSGADDYSNYLDYISTLVASVETFAVELSPNLDDLARLIAWVHHDRA